MFSSFLPKGAPFFELLLQQNNILCSISEKLVQILEKQNSKTSLHHDISTLEEEADELYFIIIKHLSQSFITPIDREDILHIAKKQETTVDLVHNMSNRLHALEFDAIHFSMVQLARTSYSMIMLTRSMLEGLSKKQDRHNTRIFRALRSETEMVLGMATAELYDLQTPTPESLLRIIRWNLAYDRMEAVIQEVAELAETIEEAVLKHA